MANIGLLIVIAAFFCPACNSQLKETYNMEDEKGKTFLCNVETGSCSTDTAKLIEEVNLTKKQKAKLIYYTDPICSACWTIEPKLKRFTLAYGEYFDIEYRMGGLLPGWEGFSDSNNGISSPKDVAHHWDEVGRHSGMSIDGDVWLEDPLSSSYPPSIAFKAMQKQGEEKALKFLRSIREMVFLEKKNITRISHLLQAVENCGGDTVQFLKDYNNNETLQIFYSEIQESRRLGVRGFPTFIFTGDNGNGYKISGTSGYENFILALEKALNTKTEAKKIELTEEELLKKYGYLATREISFVLSQGEEETISNLEQLAKLGKIEKVKQKHGIFWKFL